MGMKKIEPGDPETTSTDLVDENVERLKELFPEAFTEGKIDFDVLKGLLGGTVDEREEKYGLNWHGKRQARQLALTPSTGTLRPCPEESVDWETTQNLMIEGDNLEVLKLLQKSYAGKVKLIYIDPPYNTGKDFVYPDDFRDNIRNYMELTGQVDGGRMISSNTEASGRFHTDWLNMMYPRLKLAKVLLRRDGAIAISLDDQEQANLRLVADDVFGEENFLATVAWEKVHTRKNSATAFSKSHDYVVIYARDKSSWDRILLPREGPSAYRNPDNDRKGPWKSDPVTAHNPYSADYTITKPNGVVLKRPQGRYWAFSEDTWKAKVSAGEVIWGDGDAYPMIKRYLSEVQDGLVPITLFSRKFAGDTATAKRELDAVFGREGLFDYPKPTLLVRRLIQICARPGEVVMDFFAGSGTTGHAVAAQNAEDGGARRYVLVQLPEFLDMNNPEQRRAAEYCEEKGMRPSIAELTKTRLRELSALYGSGKDVTIDTGFRVYKLDASNLTAWETHTEDLDANLLGAVEHIKPDRTEQDVLHELLLKLGLDLCVPTETRTIAGRDVHAVGAGTLITCLAPKISAQDAESLAEGIVDWHKELNPAGDTTCVFRDSAFENDVAKTNLAAILEQHGIVNVRSL